MQPTMMSQEARQMMQQCIRDCEDCHMICMRTVQHCLTMGGDHATPDHIGMMLDCADACRTSADFMLRNSPNHMLMCSLCAQICDQCAMDCEHLANGDPMMQECAAKCRQCMESCRKMSPMMN
ncbi:MAG TPA: four-helix bundle copper-binding protein [Fimbriimonas sp.]